MKMLTILALAAIGQLSSAAADPTKIVVWTFADWTTGTQGDEIKRQVAAFEKANPDITVELDGKPSTDIIAGLIANGTAPGVDVVTTQYRASSLVQANVLSDLSGQWNASTPEFRDQFTKSFVNILNKNGKILGVPYTTTASVVYRNLDVLKKGGVDVSAPIKDWQDWLAQMEKVKGSGNYALANQLVGWFQILNFYGGVPGDTFEVKDGTSTLDKGALEKALTFMKATQAYAAPVSAFDQAEIDLFTSNKLAFVISGAWTYPTMQAAAKANGLKFELGPGSRRDGRQVRRRLRRRVFCHTGRFRAQRRGVEADKIYDGCTAGCGFFCCCWSICRQ